MRYEICDMRYETMGYKTIKRTTVRFFKGLISHISYRISHIAYRKSQYYDTIIRNNKKIP